MSGFEIEIGARVLYAAAGLSAAVFILAAVLGLRQRRRVKRRSARRRRNIAHSRAWNWLYGRKQRKQLTYRGGHSD